MEYQIQPQTRQCAASGRDLTPGEKIFTVLLEEDRQFVRRDYSCETWQGPPPNAFSFWQGRVPDDSVPRRPPIDDELLFECFQRLEGQTEPHQINFRYVAALLLMRRKRLKFEDARRADGREVLVVRCVKSKETADVVNPRLTDEEIVSVQAEVFRVLGWD